MAEKQAVKQVGMEMTRREACDNSPEGLKTFIKTVARHPHHPTQSIGRLSRMQEIIADRFHWNAMNSGRLAVKAPFRFGKTLFTTHAAAWLIGLNKNRRSIFVSAVEENAKKRSLAVRDTVEFNKIFHAIFPEVKPRKRHWGLQAWIVQRDLIGTDPTFAAFGIDSTGIGSGGDVYFDDANDMKDLYSEAVRNYRREQYKNTWKSRATEPGLFIFAIYTPWHRKDANAEFEKTAESICFAVSPCLTKLIVTTRNSPLPETFEIELPYWVTPELLKRIKEEDLGDMAFRRGMMMQSIDTTNTIIKPEWIHRKEFSEYRSQDVVLHCACDPAWGRRLNQAGIKKLASEPANSALEIGIVTAGGKLLLLEDNQSVITPEEFFDIIIDRWLFWYDKNKFPKITEGVIAFEVIGGQNYLFDRLVARCRERGVALPLKPHSQTTNKNARISALAGHFQNANIEFTPEITTVVDQALAFPFGNKVDGLDALEMLWYYARQRGRNVLPKPDRTSPTMTRNIMQEDY